jgi:hypothetical protein
MAKFKKKPVVVEAVQFLPYRKSYDEIAHLAVNGMREVQILERDGALPQLFIDTLEGQMEAKLGDWIIKGVSGELYPCKPDIFMATYEQVD